MKWCKKDGEKKKKKVTGFGDSFIKGEAYVFAYSSLCQCLYAHTHTHMQKHSARQGILVHRKCDVS